MHSISGDTLMNPIDHLCSLPMVILVMLLYLQSLQHWSHSTGFDYSQQVESKQDAAQTIKPAVQNNLPNTIAMIERTKQNYFLERRLFM